MRSGVGTDSPVPGCWASQALPSGGSRGSPEWFQWLTLSAHLVQFLARIDVAKRVRLVVETDFDDRQRRVPRIDLAAATFEKCAQVRQHCTTHEAEYRMRLIEGSRDGELRVVVD